MFVSSVGIAARLRGVAWRCRRVDFGAALVPPKGALSNGDKGCTLAPSSTARIRSAYDSLGLALCLVLGLRRVASITLAHAFH